MPHRVDDVLLEGADGRDEADDDRVDLLVVEGRVDGARGPRFNQSSLVIEAAVEDLSVKRTIFSELDAVCPGHTLLVTNSSNIVSSRVADATSRPDRVCNLHFFNPAPVQNLVEVVRTVVTAIRAASRCGTAARTC